MSIRISYNWTVSYPQYVDLRKVVVSSSRLDQWARSEGGFAVVVVPAPYINILAVIVDDFVKVEDLLARPLELNFRRLDEIRAAFIDNPKETRRLILIASDVARHRRSVGFMTDAANIFYL